MPECTAVRLGDAVHVGKKLKKQKKNHRKSPGLGVRTPQDEPNPGDVSSCDLDSCDSSDLAGLVS